MARKKKAEEAPVLEPSSDVLTPAETPSVEEKTEEPAISEKQKLLALYDQLKAMKIDNISQLEQMIARSN